MVYLQSNNIITSLGFNTPDNFEALLDGKTGIELREDINLYPDPVQASLINSGLLNKGFSQLGNPNDFTRLEKMMILSASEAMSKSDVDITSSRTGIILSTTKGNIDLLEKDKSGLFEKERILLWKLGEVIAKYFGNPNPPIVISNACISGVLAVNTAAMFIKSGKYDDVAVIGGDIVSEFVVSGFMSFMSLSPTPCRPFDKNRDGLSLGEAAGTIILSSKKKDGENIAFTGGASANDANHISGPSRTGEGSFIAIKKAMEQAKVNASDIDHISSHGTATPYNDEMEGIAISRHGMEHIPVNSFKGNWGHTLGAAGIIEVAGVISEMEKNTLVKSAGYTEHGITKEINVISANEKKEIHTCLKMASGFGGSNAALILQKV